MILHCSCDDFGSRRSIFVDQNDQRSQVGSAVSRLIGIISEPVASLLGKYPLSILQKNLSHVDRLIEKTARVISEIQDQRSHSFRMQALERFNQLISSGVVKTAGHVDIADSWLQHV